MCLGVEYGSHVSARIQKNQVYAATNDLNEIIQNVANMEYYNKIDDEFYATQEDAFNAAAAVLESESDNCYAERTAPYDNCLSPCCHVGLLLLQIRVMLLFRDKVDDRAFPYPGDEMHAHLFDDYGVLVADNEWLSRESLMVAGVFWGVVPPVMTLKEGRSHMMTMMSGGVESFLCVTVWDAYLCDGDDAASGYLNFEGGKGGINVFQTQFGDLSTNGFPLDTPLQPVDTDSFITVIRYETVHQFDHIIKDNPRLKKLFCTLIPFSTQNDDCLRSTLTADYFLENNQIIMASQIGNQYLHSSSAQLRLAAEKFHRGVVPTSARNRSYPDSSSLSTSTSETTDLETTKGRMCHGNHKLDSSLSDCVTTTQSSPCCTSGEIMWSLSYRYDTSWGCCCCPVPNPCDIKDGRHDDNKYWNLYRFAPSPAAAAECEHAVELRVGKNGCLTKDVNLGMDFETVNDCAVAALEEGSGCTDQEIMCSQYSYSWGCIYCAVHSCAMEDQEDFYFRNPNWNVYTYRDPQEACDEDQSCGLYNRVECDDKHLPCSYYVSIEECDKVSLYMYYRCQMSCGNCIDNQPANLGVAQIPTIYDNMEALNEIIRESQTYVTGEVFPNKTLSNIYTSCINYDNDCASQTAKGKCDANPMWAQLQCPLSYLCSKMLELALPCPIDPNAPVPLKPGDLNTLFEGIVTNEEYEAYHPFALSRPYPTIATVEVADGLSIGKVTDPWALAFKLFLMDEECDRLIQYGHSAGYEPSTVGETLLDSSSVRALSTNGFPLDTPLQPVDTDTFITVIRYETVHQFDHIIKDNSRLKKLFHTLIPLRLTADFLLNETLSNIYTSCVNYNDVCASQTAQGKYNADPTWAGLRWPRTFCHCEMLVVAAQCPINPNAHISLKPKVSNMIFEGILTNEEYEAYCTIVLSRPYPTIAAAEIADGFSRDKVTDLWVLAFKLCLTDKECDCLVQYGHSAGYESLAVVGEIIPDGSSIRAAGNLIGQTSHIPWCHKECHIDPLVQNMFEPMAKVTVAPTTPAAYNATLQHQFFITLDEAVWLDGNCVIFETVLGPTVFNALYIGRADVLPDTDQPMDCVLIKSVDVKNHIFEDCVARRKVVWCTKLDNGNGGGGMKSSHYVVTKDDGDFFLSQSVGYVVVAQPINTHIDATAAAVSNPSTKTDVSMSPAVLASDAIVVLPNDDDKAKCVNSHHLMTKTMINQILDEPLITREEIKESDDRGDVTTSNNVTTEPTPPLQQQQQRHSEVESCRDKYGQMLKWGGQQRRHRHIMGSSRSNNGDKNDDDNNNISKQLLVFCSKVINAKSGNIVESSNGDSFGDQIAISSGKYQGQFLSHRNSIDTEGLEGGGCKGMQYKHIIHYFEKSIKEDCSEMYLHPEVINTNCNIIIVGSERDDGEVGYYVISHCVKKQVVKGVEFMNRSQMGDDTCFPIQVSFYDWVLAYCSLHSKFGVKMTVSQELINDSGYVHPDKPVRNMGLLEQYALTELFLSIFTQSMGEDIAFPMDYQVYGIMAIMKSSEMISHCGLVNEGNYEERCLETILRTDKGGIDIVGWNWMVNEATCAMTGLKALVQQTLILNGPLRLIGRWKSLRQLVCVLDNGDGDGILHDATVKHRDLNVWPPFHNSNQEDIPLDLRWVESADTPQLYVCSWDGKIMSFEQLDKLTLHWKERVGVNWVRLMRFSKLQHYGQLGKHPDKQQEQAERLMECCHCYIRDKKSLVGGYKKSIIKHVLLNIIFMKTLVTWKKNNETLYWFTTLLKILASTCLCLLCTGCQTYWIVLEFVHKCINVCGDVAMDFNNRQPVNSTDSDQLYNTLGMYFRMAIFKVSYKIQMASYKASMTRLVGDDFVQYMVNKEE